MRMQTFLVWTVSLFCFTAFSEAAFVDVSHDVPYTTSDGIEVSIVGDMPSDLTINFPGTGGRISPFLSESAGWFTEELIADSVSQITDINYRLRMDFPEPSSLEIDFYMRDPWLNFEFATDGQIHSALDNVSVFNGGRSLITTQRQEDPGFGLGAGATFIVNGAGVDQATWIEFGLYEATALTIWQKAAWRVEVVELVPEPQLAVFLALVSLLAARYFK